MHLGKWSDPRCNAFATSIFALNGQKSPTFAECDTTLGTAISDFLIDDKSPETTAGWPEHAGVSKFPSVSPILSDRICGNSVNCKFGSASALVWTFTTVHLDHTGGKPLVFFSEGNLIVLAFTFYRPRYFDAAQSTVFEASAKGHSLTQQSAKYPPHLTAFILI